MLTLAEPTRKDFLIKMYESSWNNVNRAEDSLWKIFAAYTALFAGLGLAIDAIGNFGFLFVMTIFSFAGIFSSLTANGWFVRNMGIISNIEKEFLKFNENEVIPKEWMENKVPFFKMENWWIIVALFFIIIIAIHVIMIDKILEQDYGALIVLDILGVIFVTMYGIYLQMKHSDFVENAKGKDIP